MCKGSAENHQTSRKSARIWLANFAATGFYSGYWPWASGTAGSLAAAVLAYFLLNYVPVTASLSGGICLAAAFTLLGVYSANIVCDAGLYGPENKDPKQIVIDEFAGYFVTIIGLGGGIPELAAAFIAFRIFDIIKPPPARQMEQLPRGYGIVLDDIFAGAYAAAGARVLLAGVDFFLR
ncbi:MAG TPA: phosphatidylglycerophosphatase A [Oligoflexia bacterium]|nr:phosphatidylglycerophosphatase A [Oligoflexia bacterium]